MNCCVLRRDHCILDDLLLLLLITHDDYWCCVQSNVVISEETRGFFLGGEMWISKNLLTQTKEVSIAYAHIYEDDEVA